MKQICAVLHSTDDTLGNFFELSQKQGLKVHCIVAPTASKTDWELAKTSEILFSMGGAMGVYESSRYPFLSREIEVLRFRISENKTTLGICLGAQLLAAAADAAVYPSKKKEFGWYEVQKTECGNIDNIFGDKKLDWSKPVFHWHQDTYDLPKGATHLLKSDRCQQQAFKLSDKIYGIQFHIEFDPSEVVDWINSEPDLEYGKIDGVQSREELILGAEKYVQSCSTTAEIFLKRYL